MSITKHLTSALDSTATAPEPSKDFDAESRAFIKSKLTLTLSKEEEAAFDELVKNLEPNNLRYFRRAANKGLDYLQRKTIHLLAIQNKTEKERASLDEYLMKATKNKDLDKLFAITLLKPKEIEEKFNEHLLYSMTREFIDHIWPVTSKKEQDAFNQIYRFMPNDVLNIFYKTANKKSPHANKNEAKKEIIRFVLFKYITREDQIKLYELLEKKDKTEISALFCKLFSKSNGIETYFTDKSFKKELIEEILIINYFKTIKTTLAEDFSEDFVKDFAKDYLSKDIDNKKEIIRIALSKNITQGNQSKVSTLLEKIDETDISTFFRKMFLESSDMKIYFTNELSKQQLIEKMVTRSDIKTIKTKLFDLDRNYINKPEFSGFYDYLEEIDPKRLPKLIENLCLKYEYIHKKTQTQILQELNLYRKEIVQNNIKRLQPGYQDLFNHIINIIPEKTWIDFYRSSQNMKELMKEITHFFHLEKQRQQLSYIKKTSNYGWSLNKEERKLIDKIFNDENYTEKLLAVFATCKNRNAFDRKAVLIDKIKECIMIEKSKTTPDKSNQSNSFQKVILPLGKPSNGGLFSDKIQPNEIREKLQEASLGM